MREDGRTDETAGRRDRRVTARLEDGQRRQVTSVECPAGHLRLSVFPSCSVRLYFPMTPPAP